MIGLAEFLAWPHDTGVAGSAIVTAILGFPAYVHAHVKAGRRHQEKLAQAERHHLEAQAQAAAQHNEAKHQAEKHHQQAAAQLADEAESIKAHVTMETASRPARGSKL